MVLAVPCRITRGGLSGLINQLLRISAPFASRTRGAHLSLVLLLEPIAKNRIAGDARWRLLQFVGTDVHRAIDIVDE